MLRAGQLSHYYSLSAAPWNQAANTHLKMAFEGAGRLTIHMVKNIIFHRRGSMKNSMTAMGRKTKPRQRLTSG